MTLIIGINGFKRTGKGETANIVNELLGGHVVYDVGFSDKVKLWAAHALGYDDPDPNVLIALMDEFKETGQIAVGDSGSVEKVLTGRQYLQYIGNKARHLFGEDFWVDQVLPRVGDHADREQRKILSGIMLAGAYPHVDVLTISDLRYPNEAERIRGLGGVIWEVIRPGTESDGHESEQVLNRRLIDHQIMNTTGIDNLRWEVEKALELTKEGVAC